MRTDGNGGENPNYFPNSFDDIQIDQAYKEPLLKSTVIMPTVWSNCEGETIISQPGNLFKIMSRAAAKHHK
jgi:catalase